MHNRPTEDQMATIYSAIRYGDDLRAACKILGIPKKRVEYWLRIADRARKKQRWGDKLTKDDKACLKLDNLIMSANRRRRRG